MIIFEKITLKNFLSYGNSYTSFEFKDGVSRISGLTGHGKSSIMEGFYYCLFGSTYKKINLNQLPNALNKKELETTVHFSINETKYRIERGMKPNYFRIYVNDVLKEITSTTKSYQQILEEDILKFNSSMFDQVSYKSLTKNSTFLTLPKKDKREIIETLLDVSIYSDMNKAAKLIIDDLTKELSTIDKDLSNTNLLIQNETNNIIKLKEIKNEQESNTKEKVNELKRQIEQHEFSIVENQKALDKIQKFKDRVSTLNETQRSTANKLKKYETEKRDILNKISITKNKVQFLQSTCGECPKIQSICEEDNIDQLMLLKKTVTELIDSVTKIQLQTLDKISSLNEKIMMERSIESNIKTSKNNIANLKSQIEHENVQTIVIDDSILKSYEAQRDSLVDEYNSKFDEKKHYTFARGMLSDEAIRAFIVKKYLPSINKLLNVNIQKFVSNMTMEFDEEFEPVFKSRFKENFSYESHSEGQKKLINIAILFMFIDFCKMKYQYASTNLLILDEVTTGLDIHLQDKFYETIKKIAISENKCIIVIQHGEISTEHVDHNYNVELVFGFSKLTKEK